MLSLEEIIEGCRKGKQNAQKLLFERYSERMFGLCRYYTRSEEEAEDVLHDGFIRIFQNISKYRDGNFEGWMKTVFINLALMHYRKLKRMDTYEDINELRALQEKVVSDEPMHHEEIMLMVRELPPQYQLVFNLYAIEGYKHKEIADMLGIDEGTSKSNLSRARKILQTKLKKQYVLA